MKNKIILSIAVSSLFLTGCATILTDEKYDINVRSDKEVAVEVDGNTFKAPGIVTVKKENRNKKLTVIEDGCKQEIVLNKQIETTFWVNILSGGVFGSSTDYGSDQMWKYDDVEISCAK